MRSIPAPQPDFSSDLIKGCTPFGVNFINLTQNISNSTYLWSFGNLDSSVAVNPNEQYTYGGCFDVSLTAKDIANGCTTQINKPCYINAIQTPIAEFTIEKDTLNADTGPAAVFYNQSQYATIWNWSFGDSFNANSFNPTHEYTENGMYTVQLIASEINGCSNTTEHQLLVNFITFYVPNSFTPNGDGLNDIFLPKGNGFVYETFVMKIFDRWGLEAFETKDFTKGWDGTYKGTPATQDVYIYKIWFRDLKNKEYKYTGTVTLVR